MDKKFVFISVTTQTRDDLRDMSKKLDKNIYKIVRDIVRTEKEKIFDKN